MEAVAELPARARRDGNPVAGRVGLRFDARAIRIRRHGRGHSAERIYVDHGLTGANRERPGLREAFAACRAGDTVGAR